MNTEGMYRITEKTQLLRNGESHVHWYYDKAIGWTVVEWDGELFSVFCYEGGYSLDQMMADGILYGPPIEPPDMIPGDA